MDPDVRAVMTGELTPAELDALRTLFHVAWPDPDDAFSPEDWEHTMGGTHFVVEREGTIVSHASVVERRLEVDGRPLRTGYVEAVATLPAHRRRGFASAVVGAAGRHIDGSFELGALGTELLDFYARFGWVAWRGPTFVRTEAGPERTPEEDGYIMVRVTPSSPELDPTAPISCEWRPGDAW